jgi:hypothetical protein
MNPLIAFTPVIASGLPVTFLRATPMPNVAPPLGATWMPLAPFQSPSAAPPAS